MATENKDTKKRLRWKSRGRGIAPICRQRTEKAKRGSAHAGNCSDGDCAHLPPTLFMGQKDGDPVGFEKNAQVICAIARAALVEPACEALDEAGVKLTDQQVTAIFAYVMQGVNGLGRFRGTKRNRAKPDGAKNALPAKPNDRA